MFSASFLMLSTSVFLHLPTPRAPYVGVSINVESCCLLSAHQWTDSQFSNYYLVHTWCLKMRCFALILKSAINKICKLKWLLFDQMEESLQIFVYYRLVLKFPSLLKFTINMSSFQILHLKAELLPSRHYHSALIFFFPTY